MINNKCSYQQISCNGTEKNKRIELNNDPREKSTAANENIFPWLSDNFVGRKLPTELINIIFSYFAGQGHLEQLIEMGHMRAGWNIVCDIIMRGIIIISNNYNETFAKGVKQKEPFIYYDQAIDNGEFNIYIGSFSALKELLDNDHLNIWIRKINIRFTHIHPDRYKDIKKYLFKLKDQLESLNIESLPVGNEYLKDLPIFKNVIEVEYTGKFGASVPFKFHEKCPKATAIGIFAGIDGDKEEDLVNCTNLKVFKAEVGFGCSELLVQKIIASNDNLQAVSLSRTREFTTIEELCLKENLTKLKLGKIA